MDDLEPEVRQWCEDSLIKIGVSLGYSRQIGDRMWEKPDLYMEFTVPDSVDSDEFIEAILEFMTPKFDRVRAKIFSLIGMPFSAKVYGKHLAERRKKNSEDSSGV